MINSCVSYSDVMTNVPDLMFDISFFCDHKALCALQGVSKRWHVIAGNDRVWRSLFARHFPQTLLPKTHCKEAFRSRLAVIRLDTLEKVDQAILTFVCELKWNTERQLVCDFPGEPFYSCIIQQRFGDKWRTEGESFGAAPEEKKYLEYNGENCFCEAFEDTMVVPCLETGISLCISAFGSSPSSITPFRRDWVSHENIEHDVGWGNTLGYCSSINNWKSPFQLHCVPGKNGRPVWTGLFPRDQPFKFVLIDAKGGITWERFNGYTSSNRVLASSRYTIETSLGHMPLKF